MTSYFYLFFSSAIICDVSPYLCFKDTKLKSVLRSIQDFLVIFMSMLKSGTGSLIGKQKKIVFFFFFFKNLKVSMTQLS